MAKVLKMLKLDKDDAQDLREVIENCNMAAAFFFDDRINQPNEEEGLKSLTVLNSGTQLDVSNLDRVLNAINAAINRIVETSDSPMFPYSLRQRYIDNLAASYMKVIEWKKLISD